MRATDAQSGGDMTRRVDGSAQESQREGKAESRGLAVGNTQHVGLRSARK